MDSRLIKAFDSDVYFADKQRALEEMRDNEKGMVFPADQLKSSSADFLVIGICGRRAYIAERISAADPKHIPATKTIDCHPGISRYDFCGFRGL